MATTIRDVVELAHQQKIEVPKGWHLRAIRSEECQSYIGWNSETQEALVVDPKLEDRTSYLTVQVELQKKCPKLVWIGVIDTHTHADHVSIAAELASQLHAPLIMHEKAPSRRVTVRIARSTRLNTSSGPLFLLETPGHTPDSLTAQWGPFLFTGDTVLYGDTGRDDLPGGDAAAHFESLQSLRRHATESLLVLPGHDSKGGRLSTWGAQLRENSSLLQSRDDFVREASAFEAPAPKLLKESLRENFR